MARPKQAAKAPKSSGLGLEFILDLVQKVFDPAFIEGLSPAEGLQVEGLTFQSTETEGHWKTNEAFDARKLSHSHMGDGKKDPFGKAFSDLRRFSTPLLTLNVTGDFTSSARVDATWWGDELEIYAGYAGLARANGWTMVWDNRASVTLEGVSFGNYFPAKYLITMTGFVNPIGPEFLEFRGAVVIGADGFVSEPSKDPAASKQSKKSSKAQKQGSTPYPAYMECWKRDGSEVKAPVVTWAKQDGFKIQVVSIDAHVEPEYSESHREPHPLDDVYESLRRSF